MQDPAKAMRLLWGSVVVFLTGLYYVLFYFPPRLVGVNDPDRFYHLALSRLMSSQEGLVRSLPQVEDLGWDRYFPDKEFLFHVLTGAADWLAGAWGVMMVVPLLGIAIIVSLYVELSRVIKPRHAALLVMAVSLLTTLFIFRLTILRPHLLAILFFCLLVVAILRGRPWLAALASAGFALSYHAIYIALLVIGIAALFRWQEAPGGARRWQWAIAGLVVGVVLNPYFPSNLLMGWTTLQIALGIDVPPGAIAGTELLPLGAKNYFLSLGFLPLCVLGVGALLAVRKLRPTPENSPIWFLFVLSLSLTVLSMKSTRASEYAIPCVILMCGYAASQARVRWWLPLNLGALLVIQSYMSWLYYDDIWNESQAGDSTWYLAAVSLLPPEAEGRKVFNCQWGSGAYILYARPGVRFVDVLDPALLWRVSPQKYLIRQGLIDGGYAEPHLALKEVFQADYVLCGSPALNRQMEADPRHFRAITGTEPVGPLRVFELISR